MIFEYKQRQPLTNVLVLTMHTHLVSTDSSRPDAFSVRHANKCNKKISWASSFMTG